MRKTKHLKYQVQGADLKVHSGAAHTVPQGLSIFTASCRQIPEWMHSGNLKT